MNFSTIIDLETKLLDPEVRKSEAVVDSLLDDSFVEFGTSGQTYDKKIIIERLSHEVPSTIEAFDFIPIQLAADVVQLRFKTKRTSDDGLPTYSLRSSIWKRQAETWKMVFHQGTKTSV